MWLVNWGCDVGDISPMPPPKEAHDFLSRKLLIETENWDDLKSAEHAHAFTVAHSRDAQVLNDIFGLLKEAQTKGQPWEEFHKGLKGVMEEKGWYGRADKGADDKDYATWRSKLIYHTNMRTSYSAGRYRKQVKGADLRPIWIYGSKLVGEHRREEHIALHDCAFRYDDPFWILYYPPNEWGCECFVTTSSETGAERAGIEILETDEEGNPPARTDQAGVSINWNTFASDTWKVNPGREAMVPNFREYENLANYKMFGKSAREYLAQRYRDDMDQCKVSNAEFQVFIRRFKERDYNPQGILFEVGCVDTERYTALMKEGIQGPQVMATDTSLRHSTGDKNPGHVIPERLFPAWYETFQKPERIYENVHPRYPRLGKEYHFVTSTGDGKVLKAVLRQTASTTALNLITAGWVEDQYDGTQFRQIW